MFTALQQRHQSGNYGTNRDYPISDTSSLAMGQPGLPSAPAQAPIDGGLGLLAAAGGAYAYKKLKGRNSESEDV
ncbi:MAG: hypothetical protein RJQ34_03820 [Balneola sp.]